MNSHENDSDDVTLAAGDDVVAQIRAHAAKVRRGEATADDGIQVWTAHAEQPETHEPGKLLPNDQTVPLQATRAELAQAIADADLTEQPVVDLRSAAQPTNRAGSLIEGQATPQASISFWETDQPFRASGIETPQRMRGRGGVPLMAWIALVLVVIVLISVGIAVAIAATGPMA